MRVASGYALMAVPATGRLDMHLVQAAVGDPHVRLATEEELLRDFPGIELGALPPLGSLLGAPLYVDQEVLQHETVVFAAGSQTESVQIKMADLPGAGPAGRPERLICCGGEAMRGRAGWKPNQVTDWSHAILGCQKDGPLLNSDAGEVRAAQVG